MQIDATGFVGEHSGSVASANAVILERLLARGNRIRFFSKPTFVDPRKLDLPANAASNLSVVDCTNWRTDYIRQRTAKIPLISHFTRWADVASYNNGLVRQMRAVNLGCGASDLILCLGDHVRGRVAEIPTVGYLQGPPATDARSVFKHKSLIIQLAGLSFYLKLHAYASWRMRLGSPDLSISDHLIVGSEWSRSELVNGLLLQSNRVHALPYPIDLNQFRPDTRPRETNGRLTLLWLGRFVPRKRLDLFLDAIALAIRGGCDVDAIVIGRSGFVPNYEQLLRAFPFPERLKHQSAIHRTDVPNVLANVDVMAQPSDDENFGSSVAESLACGVPVIVGATNGTGDYICDRSVRLVDDRAETMAAAIGDFALRKKRGDLQDREPSRRVALKYFDPEVVVDKLITILSNAASAKN